MCGRNRNTLVCVRWDEQWKCRLVRIKDNSLISNSSNTTNTNKMDITGGIAIIFFFSCAFGIMYLYFTTRHRERMAMIDKGMTDGLRKPPPDPRRALKEGMQWVAAAIGLGLGYLMDTMISDRIEEIFIYLGAVAFTVGIANIIYHLMFHKKELKGEEARVL